MSGHDQETVGATGFAVPMRPGGIALIWPAPASLPATTRAMKMQQSRLMRTGSRQSNGRPQLHGPRSDLGRVVLLRTFSFFSYTTKKLASIHVLQPLTVPPPSRPTIFLSWRVGWRSTVRQSDHSLFHVSEVIDHCDPLIYPLRAKSG